MNQRADHEDEDGVILSADFDWDQIFIGREQQLEFFRIYLERWQRQAAAAPAKQLGVPPSLNDKLPGLVVLLYGRGGFGKTTLLKHYREIALDYKQDLTIGDPVDWEFAVQGHQALFNPAPGEDINASQYFALLCNQLAIALGKHSEDFKEYQSAIKDVEEATKLAQGVLGGLQRDERYSWLRGLAAEGVLALLRLIPHSQVILNNEQVANKIKEATGESIQVGIEQVQQVWARLHDKLGSKFDNYLKQPLRLGLGIGNDLAQFAKKYPLLIFFDTYEEIDEGDEFLRLVMGAAGSRVGWVISGRDNLWAGLTQRLRSQDMVYGYRDIVFSNLGLAVDFSADGVGDFTSSDIEEYFAKLGKKVSRRPPLPTVTEKDAAHILNITRGVPLAVKIAAGLYLQYPNLTFLTEGTEGMDSRREIVDQMVQRYLLHTRTNPADRARLYGLALVRRTESPLAIESALDLPASSSSDAELKRLHRRYGFIFTQQEQPSLHQEVRYFMRMWLLKHRTEAGIVEINQRIKEAHLTALKALEANRQYTSIRTRLEDDEWMECYLDFAEQNFWLDPAQGVISLLPFMFAAAIYRRDANGEAFNIGAFFEPVINQPYSKRWKAVANSLRYKSSRNPLPDELTGLKDLVKLANDNVIAFEPPLPSAQYELKAALWCRLGEAYQGRQEDEARYWYDKAISQLSQETDMSEQEAKVLLDVDLEDRKHEESMAPAPAPKPIPITIIAPPRVLSSDQPLHNQHNRGNRVIGLFFSIAFLVSLAATSYIIIKSNGSTIFAILLKILTIALNLVGLFISSVQVFPGKNDRLKAIKFTRTSLSISVLSVLLILPIASNFLITQPTATITTARSTIAQADFMTAPPTLSPMTILVRNDSIHYSDHAILEPDGQVVIAFTLSQGMNQVTCTVNGLVSRLPTQGGLGSQDGFAPINLFNNGNEFQANFIASGNGISPNNTTFQIPPQQLKAGKNQLELQVASNAASVFWLYQLTINQSRAS